MTKFSEYFNGMDVISVPRNASILHHATPGINGIFFDMDDIEEFELVNYDGTLATIEATEEYMDANYDFCEVCSRYAKETETASDGREVCRHCIVEGDDYEFCEDCGEVHPTEDLTYIEGFGDVCGDCIDDSWAQCIHCGEWFRRDDMVWTSNDDLICEECYENNYTTCQNCGDVYLTEELHYVEDSDEFLCDSCYEDYCNRHARNSLSSYHNGRPYKFFSLAGESDYAKSGNEYYGREHEFPHIGETNYTLAGKVCEGYKAKCEHDGSVRNGFEVISDAMTWDYLKTHKDIDTLIPLMKENGFRVDDSAGIHVHVSRTFLTQQGIGRIAKFVYDKYDDLMKFGRRRNTSYCHIPNRGYVHNNDNYVEWNRACMEHSYALNLTHQDTIEFRMFNCTDDIDHAWAIYEFVHAICQVSKTGENVDITWDMVHDYARTHEGHEHFCKEALDLNFVSAYLPSADPSCYAAH